MTDFLDIDGGRIAYDVAGEGPLTVLAHGIGDRRQAYRFLAPALVPAGFRVAATDMRGHGDSSIGDWASISRTDVAGDLVALIRHLGGLLRIRRYRRAMVRMGGTQIFRSLLLWMSYLDVAYPGKPADYADYMAALRAKLTEPGRMAEFLKTFKTTPADAEAPLPSIRCSALIIMGTEDPDFADPRAEAEAIVAAMPAGLGAVAMIEGAGHYPHAQCPDEVAGLITSFLREHTLA